MAISFADDNADDADMLSEINTTPLVDVMLVLLIIFLITIPVVNASVAVRLPREANQLRASQSGHVIISVTATGATYWHDLALPNRAALSAKLLTLATQRPQPEVHIRADAGADYAAVAKVVLACEQAGISRIGFLTEPPQTR